MGDCELILSNKWCSSSVEIYVFQLACAVGTEGAISEGVCCANLGETALILCSKVDLFCRVPVVSA